MNREEVMDELARKRADKKQDSREWSCLDALEDLIERIKSGEINPAQMAIHFYEKTDSGRTHHFQVANLTYPEHIALLAVASHRVITEWHT
jgi:hypothetical protein